MGREGRRYGAKLESIIILLSSLLSFEKSTYFQVMNPSSDEFENAFFALNEDRSYLGTIISRLISEAEIERKQEALRKETEWLTRIQTTNAGEITSDYSLKVLKEAKALGFEIAPTENHTIVVSKSGRGTSYLHSNAAIERFAKIEKIQISKS